jgi:hypothetical protein
VQLAGLLVIAKGVLERIADATDALARLWSPKLLPVLFWSVERVIV